MSKAAELAALIANVNNGSSLGNKNLIINGAMNVAQRGTSSTGLGASAGYFTADRWDMYFTGTAGRLTQAQIADGPSGFANCMKLSCTTADTSIAAGENVILQQHIEGQNCQALCKGTADAKPITVSFWVKGNASATYTCGLWDNDNSRQNNQTFAVTTSWNRIELTFPADTTGALDDDTANSLGFYIYLQAGSTYTGGTFTSGTWASVTNANTVKSDQTQFFDSTSRTFFITGVQLEIGEKATEFEHEPFETTLAKCHRYFVKINDDFTGSNAYHAWSSIRWGSNQQFATVALPQPIRGQATVTITGTTGVTFKCDGSSDGKTAVVHLNTEKTGLVSFYGNSLSFDPANSKAGTMFINDDSSMQFDAEL